MDEKIESTGIKRKTGFVLPAFLSAAAISVSGKYTEANTFLGALSAQINGVTIEYLIIFLGLCFFYCKADEKKIKIRHWSIPLIAMVFSGFMLIGLSFTQNGNLNFVLGSKIQFCIALFTFFGYFYLFQTVISVIYFFLDRLGIQLKTHEKKFVRLRAFVGKHTFACSFLIILLFWLPWLIAFLPASLPYDGTKSLLQSIGEMELTDQHSWVLVLLMGVFYNLGSQISDNCGLLLIHLVYVLFELLCYAGSCKIIRKWKLPSWVTVFMVLFFSIYPYFGTYAQAVVKDSPFMAAFVLYMTLYIDTCLFCRNGIKGKVPGKAIWGRVLSLLLIGYLVCILRNNGPYLVLSASLFLILILNKGFRRYAVVVLAGACSLVWIHGNILAPAAGVRSITSRAKLSITFQIAGRYTLICPEDLTEEESEALCAVFTNISEPAELGERYEPELSDSIKFRYNEYATEEEIDAYMDVIYTMIKRHPRVCLEAVLNQSFGYYYPFYLEEVMGTYQFYIQDLSTDTFEGFDIYYIGSGSVRKLLKNYAELCQQIPGLSLLVNSAFPTWAMLFLAGYLAYRRKWREILVFAAPAVNMAICMLSPVNGCARYAMPSLACIPALVIWTMLVTRENLLNENTQ